jgi:hypothetical protein
VGKFPARQASQRYPNSLCALCLCEPRSLREQVGALRQARRFARRRTVALDGVLEVLGEFQQMRAHGVQAVMGREARTRRQIDQLQKKIKHYERQSDTLPEEHPKRGWYGSRIQALLDEKCHCWRRHNARNRALAHLASNVILLLCRVQGCSLVAIENLSTLKSTGRGKGVQGRWRQ